jgi:hypothetical protein
MLVNRFEMEKIYEHITWVTYQSLFLLLQNNMSSDNISIDRPTGVLKADMNTLQLGI